jgi:hypothetical protein
MIDIKVEYNFAKSVALYRHFFEKEVKGTLFLKNYPAGFYQYISFY